MLREQGSIEGSHALPKGLFVLFPPWESLAPSPLCCSPALTPPLTKMQISMYIIDN